MVVTFKIAPFFLFCDSSSRNNLVLSRVFIIIESFSDGNIKQHGLFSNTPKYDTPFHSAGVAGSTVM